MTSAIKDRDQLRATQEKFVLEEAQRKEARERGDKAWIPKLFHLDLVTSEWTYRHIEYEHAVTRVLLSFRRFKKKKNTSALERKVRTYDLKMTPHHGVNVCPIWQHAALGR